ncbi:MAG: AbrB family transcriptional regulator [Rhodospirillaceae bacterium]|nr:AbrB family transcriptional regulator [Rhodospirillaceae bacterium]
MSESFTPQSHPEKTPLARPGFAPIAMSLGIGAIGGAVFAATGIPLAWMLGPMVVNIVASVRGAPVLVPHGVRVITLCVIGVLLGGSFSPDLLDRVGEWALSLALMVMFIPLITVIASYYYRRFAQFDGPTAMFSGAPGTLTAMVIIGGDSGADERMIALAQGLRVVFVVFLMPLIVTLAMSRGPSSASFLPDGGPFNMLDGGLLLVAVALGLVLARAFKLPASAMTGAMIASAALYLTGSVSWRPPDLALWVCLWILGSAIGSRFSTVTAQTFFRVGRHAIVATAIVIGVSAIFSLAVSSITGAAFLATLLSFTPGGVAEMCLIAIAFDIDPAFVAVHHLVRIAILITAAPFVAKWIASRS